MYRQVGLAIVQFKGIKDKYAAFKSNPTMTEKLQEEVDLALLPVVQMANGIILNCLCNCCNCSWGLETSTG